MNCSETEVRSGRTSWNARGEAKARPAHELNVHTLHGGVDEQSECLIPLRGIWRE